MVVVVILLRLFRTPTDDSLASRTLTGINEEHFSSFGKALGSLENLARESSFLQL